ncbi:MAG: bifunctional phosphopantothenoylcysteine decarboxylase/phosphopantothenate--cysteine ligase CoaBC [Azospirillum brasilense]|nr:MAG: bifunctional phosphopantothenoylcysteine decarboxylase/phosphopantothenate--cysteine ligase CoaBC [Azospirillum brasilense]
MALPRSVLLIISGSVSAYKSLELIRLLKAEGVAVTTILTRGGAKFVTPLAVSSLTGTKTYDDLFSLTDEVEMGHIQLSRIADCVLVAPASADMLAKMHAGMADDLATTALLATNKPVIVAPAMNHKMWHHPATQRNLAQLRADGVQVIDPTEGDMACGEHGIGRLAEPKDIVAFLRTTGTDSGALAGKHAIVTSGPTHEPIDPVRFIGNRSSGKQGHAIAAALAQAGARVTLISGPTQQATPTGVTLVPVMTGEEMLRAAEAALPADIFVGAAAVADWKASNVAGQKIKKQNKLDTLSLDFLPTVDVLAAIAQHAQRPALVVAFAAETENVIEHARAKRTNKGADWILANDVSGDVFGADTNEVTLITAQGEHAWPRMDKRAVADQLVEAISNHLSQPKPQLVKSKKG